MGTWDIAPWDNDGGADWFGGMFKKTRLDEYVRNTLLNGDPLDDYEEIRAAASMVLMLGHTYVWPIDHIDDDLALAASKLEGLLEVSELKEVEAFQISIRDEIQELRSRIFESDVKPPVSKSGKKWWEFWK